MPEVKFQQEKIEVNGQEFFVTHIPTCTSGCWYVIHDLFEMWAAVAIDLDGSIVGWRNPPDKYKTEIEAAIKKVFGLPVEEMCGEHEIQNQT